MSINPLSSGIQGTTPAGSDLKAAYEQVNDLDRDIQSLTVEEAQLGQQLSVMNTDKEKLKEIMFSGNEKRDGIKKNMWLIGLAGLVTYIGASLSTTPILSVPLGVLGLVEFGAEAYQAKKLISTRKEIKQAVREINDQNGQHESLYFDHKLVKGELGSKIIERGELKPLAEQYTKQKNSKELQTLVDHVSGETSQTIEEDREEVNIDGVRLEKKKFGSLSSLKRILHLDR